MRLKLMTFNIRNGAARDGSNSWPKRRSALLKMLAAERPDICGLQEVLAFQVDEIGRAFATHTLSGVGRDDGIRSGEFAPIMFLSHNLNVFDGGTFWLSETPQVPGSRSWNSACTRICTWVDFGSVLVFNCHLDHVSAEARIRGVEAILTRMAALNVKAQILMGDFNENESGPTSYIIRQAGFRDTYRTVYPSLPEPDTFHNFEPGQSRSGKIDSIFVSSEVQVRAAEIVLPRAGETLPSDHYPVSAVIELAGPP